MQVAGNNFRDETLHASESPPEYLLSSDTYKVDQKYVYICSYE